MRLAVVLVVLALGSCASAGATPTEQSSLPVQDPLAGRTLVDLTHPFDAQTLYWPTDTTGFAFTTLHHGSTPGGYFYAANSFCTAEHGGTHLDAPIHFAEGKTTADAVPLARLIGPALIIDITQQAAKDADALLGVAELEAFERAHGAIAEGSLVLVRTGWSSRWPNRKAYLGDDTPGNTANLHFPGISGEAAVALVARRVGAVGIDTASIDHGPSRDFMAHRTLMAADIPAFENLTGLEALPARGAFLIALPMKIAGGSGGPLRVVALLP